jgi:hypothetical protein
MLSPSLQERQEIQSPPALVRYWTFCAVLIQMAPSNVLTIAHSSALASLSSRPAAQSIPSISVKNEGRLKFSRSYNVLAQQRGALEVCLRLRVHANARAVVCRLVPLGLQVYGEFG